MEFHEFANVFPLLEGKEFDALLRDVRDHGIREPVVIYEDKILDGRNRWNVCQVLGIEAPTRQFDGSDALEFVVSLNLHRRHLTTSQRSMIGARIANLKGRGRPAEIASYEAISESTAAKMMKVGRSSVQRAGQVIESAAPEVARAVERGEITVKVAADIANAPREEQVEAVAQGVVAVKELRAKVKPSAKKISQKEVEADVEKHKSARAVEDKTRCVTALRDFVWGIETKVITPKVIFESLPAWQLAPKGVLMEFLSKVAKLAAARVKKQEKEQRAWRKKWKRERMIANKRLAIARRKQAAKQAKAVKASVKASRSRKRIRTAKAPHAVRRPARRTGDTKQRRSARRVGLARVGRRLSHPSASV